MTSFGPGMFDVIEMQKESIGIGLGKSTVLCAAIAKRSKCVIQTFPTTDSSESDQSLHGECQERCRYAIVAPASSCSGLR